MSDFDEELRPFTQVNEKLEFNNTFKCVPLFGDFSSDEESFPSLQIDFTYNDSDCSEDFEQEVKNEVRKNRRKATTPQRAVQAEFCSEASQNGSVENTSESSQDGSKSEPTPKTEEERLEKFTDKFENLPENLFDLEGEEILDPFKDDDIFKDLQEETDGEQLELDSDIIDNVKEEWKAHWGVKCNMCESLFPLKAEFDKHYQVNYNLFPVYTCTFCNKSFEKYATFRSHCYRHITEGRYKCLECAKGFSLQSLLHVHVLAKHTRAKPFKCEECGRTFVTKPGLKIHLKKHQTEAKEDYPCVECGKVLHTRGGLTSHMNVHRLGRRFMCDVCGKTFTQKVNLQQHVKQHTGDKPHACDKCDKSFSERSHLVRHFSLHSDIRPFKCTVCEKMYKTERCLKVHSLVHSTERPFVCEKCNKGFLSSTKLKQHYNIHTGERPFKCKYCERTFTNYPNWLKHTRRRHKVDHRTGALLNPPQPKKLKNIVPKPSPLTEVEPEQHVRPNNQVKLELKLETQTPPNFISPPTPLMSQTSQMMENIESNVNPMVENLTMVGDHLINDLNLAKAEEMLLQHGLLNFPLLDDKVVINQQFDLLSAHPSTSVGVGTHYFGPYFQTTIPGQTIIHSAPSNLLPLPMHLNDFITTNIVQQTYE